MKEETLINNKIPLLILANKQDEENAMKIDEIEKNLKLNELISNEKKVESDWFHCYLW